MRTGPRGPTVCEWLCMSNEGYEDAIVQILQNNGITIGDQNISGAQELSR